MKPDFDQTEFDQTEFDTTDIVKKNVKGNFFQNSTRNPDRTNVGPGWTSIAQNSSFRYNK